jgi:carbon-monoxide dehydrogenase medium subunit
VKPAPFAYRRAEDLDHALELLGEHGDEAKVVAGGQSLVAVMNLRLSRPSMLVDIDRVPGLAYVLPTEGHLRVGALTRHRHVEQYPGVLDGFELLPRAARHIGHLPIRTRGTFGGSIAHADPAAEWVLLAVLLDAQVVLRSRAGERVVDARDFFHGFFMTAAAPDELVTEVRFPRPAHRSAITEFARRHGDFAVVSAAVALDVDDAGRVCRPAIALGGVASVPLRLPSAEAMLDGEPPREKLLDEVARVAAAAFDDPPADQNGDAHYRRHLARTLVRRALEEALR